MSRIFCNINGRKYRCLMCKDYVTFTDVKDKDSFLTVEKNQSITISKLINHPFFKRTVYN